MKYVASAAALLAACVLASCAAGGGEQATLNPGVFNYPDKYDSVKAAPGQHKLLYEDENVRFIEVIYLPHQLGDAFHSHPYPSVFAFPSVRPEVKDTALDPNSKTAFGKIAGPPGTMDAPRCFAMGPQAPHRPENLGDIPDHFYRIEFKHMEGNDFHNVWKKNYPQFTKRQTVAEWLKASGKKPFGQAKLNPPAADAASKTTINPKEFPYPDSYDSVAAAPGQHWLRYENDALRFIEVVYVPNIKGDAMHGHPFASVFAYPSERPKVSGNNLDAEAAAKVVRADGPAPEGMDWPKCTVMGVQAPHQPEVTGDFPDHFYRIEFKRLDGEGFKDHWKEWYPQMAKDAAKVKPAAK